MDKPSMVKVPLPPMPSDFKMFQVIFKGREGYTQFGGRLSEIEELERAFINKTGKVVRVSHDLIDTSEIATIQR